MADIIILIWASSVALSSLQPHSLTHSLTQPFLFTPPSLSHCIKTHHQNYQSWSVGVEVFFLSERRQLGRTKLTITRCTHSPRTAGDVSSVTSNDSQPTLQVGSQVVHVLTISCYGTPSFLVQVHPLSLSRSLSHC